MTTARINKYLIKYKAKGRNSARNVTLRAHTWEEAEAEVKTYSDYIDTRAVYECKMEYVPQGSKRVIFS